MSNKLPNFLRKEPLEKNRFRGPLRSLPWENVWHLGKASGIWQRRWKVISKGIFRSNVWITYLWCWKGPFGGIFLGTLRDPLQGLFYPFLIRLFLNVFFRWVLFSRIRGFDHCLFPNIFFFSGLNLVFWGPIGHNKRHLSFTAELFISPFWTHWAYIFF